MSERSLFFRVFYCCLSLLISTSYVLPADARHGWVELAKNVGTACLKVAGAGLLSGTVLDTRKGPRLGNGYAGAPADRGTAPTAGSPAMGSARDTSEYRGVEASGRSGYGSDLPMTDTEFYQGRIDNLTIESEKKTLTDIKKDMIVRYESIRRDKARGKPTWAQENELAVVEAEYAKRQPKSTFFSKDMSDVDLDKNIRNLTDELQRVKDVYEEAAKPDFWGRKGNTRCEENEVKTVTSMLERYQSEKARRVNAKAVNMAATGMVLTSKTTGTESLSKMEPVQPKEDNKNNGGGGSGGDNNGGDKKPDKNPWWKDALGLGGVKSVTHSSEPHPTPAKEKRPIIKQSTTEVPKHDIIPELNKPYHETGVLPTHPSDPHKKEHIWDKRRGHFEKETDVSKEAMAEVIMQEGSYVGSNKSGNLVYEGKSKICDDQQVWIHTRNGEIVDSGINENEWTREQILKSKRPDSAKNDSYQLWSFFGTTLGLDAILGTSTTEASEVKPQPKVTPKVDKQPEYKLPDAPGISVHIPDAPPDQKPHFTTQTEMPILLKGKIFDGDFTKLKNSATSNKEAVKTAVKPAETRSELSKAIMTAIPDPKDVKEIKPIEIPAPPAAHKPATPASTTKSVSKPVPLTASKTSGSSSSKSSGKSSKYGSSSGWDLPSGGSSSGSSSKSGGGNVLGGGMWNGSNLSGSISRGGGSNKN